MKGGGLGKGVVGSVPASMQGRRQSFLFKPESLNGHNSHSSSKNHIRKEQRRAPLLVGRIVEPVTFATQVLAVEMFLVDLVLKQKSEVPEAQYDKASQDEAERGV